MEGLERLRYFDGELLTAVDLRTEQHYLVAMRRRLNRGLFGAGVVDGLHVSMRDAHTVTVTDGLALDPAGREMLLPSDTIVEVPVRPPSSPTLGGYLLVIRYDEQRVPGAFDDCKQVPGITPVARIRERPVLAWVEEWPDWTRCGQKGSAADCAVVLALVQLDSSCSVTGVQTSARQWVDRGHSGRANPVALEGEKDIDVDNPKLLHFHVRGGPPDSVVLYLWGDRFSNLYYTQLGGHTHSLDGMSTEDTTTDLGGHTHETTMVAGAHSHGLVTVLGDGAGGSVYVDPIDAGATANDYVVGVADHAHDTGYPVPDESSPHSHALQGDVAQTGAADVSALSVGGLSSYGYPDKVTVYLDGADITAKLVQWLQQGNAKWSSIGDGTATHPLVTEGTGPVDLVALGFEISIGEHTLTMSVDQGGGRLRYNLYVQ